MTRTWTSLCLTLSFCIFMVSELLCMEQEVKPSCAETDKECEFFWTIDYMWTMNVYDKEPKAMRPVLIRNGSLFINNCDSFIPMTAEDLDSVVTADGRYVVIFAINNQFPGPNIVVYENQTIVVHVKNNLINEAVTIHWHGLPQEGTPWMDGVSMLSQYPINRGETFTYRFRASPPGTFWYHSHHGTMTSNGLAGTLVILPREDPRPKIAEELEKDFILTLTDWYVDLTVFGRYTMEISSGYRYQRGFEALCERWILTGLDGSPVNLQDFESALINGKGWIFDENRNPIAPELPLEKFEFASGKIYKFRLINIGSIQSYRFSIDQHNLTVIAADCYDVEPLDVESLVIAPGERYDVLVTADQIPQSYWIRAETLLARLKDGSRIEPDQTLGILNYIGADDTLPSSQRRNCTETDPCVILGCQFAQEVYDIFGMNNKCVYDSELIPTVDNILRTPVPIPEPGEEILEMFLNFHFQELVRTHAAINGRQHLDPPFPLQLSVGQQFEDNIPELVQCNASACEVGCTCTHMLKVQKGQIVQFILTSQESAEEGPAHPIHLHGTHFHVLKTAFPQYNSNGMVSKPSPDIISSEYYTSVSWANKDWYGDNIPGLNLKNPPMKDTLVFTSEGYSVIRFRADNPGFWLLHCHLKPHSIMGMSMILQVGETSEMPPVPRGYPGRFVSGTSYPTGNNYWYQVGIAMCCTVLVLLIVVQLVCLTKQRRKNRGNTATYRYVPSRCSHGDETTRLVGNNYIH